MSSGCGSSEGASDVDSESVYGGGPVPDNLYPAVGQTNFGCSGALVGPRLFLTARHCVDDWGAFSLSPRKVRFYAGAPDYRVIDYLYDLADPEGDIALLLLDRDVSGVAPLPISPADLKQNDDFTIVGFGAPANVKMMGDGKVDLGISLTAFGRTSPTGLVVENQVLGAVGCPGDSGAPLLNASGQIAAVHVSGLGACGPGKKGYAISASLWRNRIAEWSQKLLAHPGNNAPPSNFNFDFDWLDGFFEQDASAYQTPITLKMSIFGDYDGDECPDSLTWYRKTEGYPDEPEHLELDPCNGSSKVFQVSGVMFLVPMRTPSGDPLVLVHLAGARVRVLDGKARTLSNEFSMGGSFRVRGFFATQADGNPNLVATTNTKVIVVDVRANQQRVYDRVTWDPANSNGPPLPYGFGLAGVFDLDGVPGDEIIIHGNNRIDVIVDERGPQSAVKEFNIPYPVDYRIGGPSDLDGDGDLELPIAQQGQISILDWNRDLFTRSVGTSGPFTGFAINGLYDTDGLPGTEVVLLMANHIKIYDSARDRLRSYPVAPPYTVKRAADEDGQPGAEIRVFTNGTEVVIKDSGDGTAPPLVVPLYRTVAPTKPDHFYVLNHDWATHPPSPYEWDRTEACVYAEGAAGLIRLRRFYHPGIDRHYYHTDALGALPAPFTSQHEESSQGFVATSPAPGMVPLYGLHNPTTKNHFYFARVEPPPEDMLPGYTFPPRILGYVFLPSLSPTQREDAAFAKDACRSVTISPQQGSRPRLAVSAGKVYVDEDGDHHFGSASDVQFQFGGAADLPFAGDLFDSHGALGSNGVFEFGVFRQGWLFADVDGKKGWSDGDLARSPMATGAPIHARPFVIDFDGDGREELGLFDPTDCKNGCRILIDTNHDLSFSAEKQSQNYRFGASDDLPVVRRRSVGPDEFAVFRAGTFFIDRNANLAWDSGDTSVTGFGAAGDLPVAFPVSGGSPGSDDVLGVYRPSSGHFHFDLGPSGWNPEDPDFNFGSLSGHPVALR
ncbi:MAG: S1 family peptidase [Deltaproteobacteria bacterium]|nr:S1 family peptidase [Deltaproteobacteria bacterium]